LTKLVLKLDFFFFHFYNATHKKLRYFHIWLFGAFLQKDQFFSIYKTGFKKEQVITNSFIKAFLRIKKNLQLS